MKFLNPIIFYFLCFLLFLTSCTEEDGATIYSYTNGSSIRPNEKKSGMSISLNRYEDTILHFYIENDSLEHDQLNLLFPNDHSTIENKTSVYYEYTYNKQGLIKDSSRMEEYYFKLNKNDVRMKVNEFLIIEIRNSNQLIFKDTLYKDTFTYKHNILDGLPIPKFC